MRRTTGRLGGMLAGVALAVLLRAATWAGLEDGVAAYGRGDYAATPTP